MSLRFAYTQKDGTTALVIAAPKEALLPIIGKPNKSGIFELSDGDYRQFVINKSIPKDAIEIVELPKDWVDPGRTSRKAVIASDPTLPKVTIGK